MISHEIVEAAWEEVDAIPEEQVEQELSAAMERQSGLFVFAAAMGDDLSPDASELVGYLTFTIYRMFEKSMGEELPEISDETIEEALDRNEQFFSSLEGTDEAIIERIASVMGERQPYVFSFLFHVLFEDEDDEDEPLIDEEDLGAVFFIMKTVIDVLDQHQPN